MDLFLFPILYLSPLMTSHYQPKLLNALFYSLQESKVLNFALLFMTTGPPQCIVPVMRNVPEALTSYSPSILESVCEYTKTYTVTVSKGSH